jgi:sugar phosphate permease
MQYVSPETITLSIDSDIRANLRRRRWHLLLPAAFVTYNLAYLDRANFGFGVAAGMTTSLHITGGLTSLLGSLFSLVTLRFSFLEQR